MNSFNKILNAYKQQKTNITVLKYFSMISFNVHFITELITDNATFQYFQNW